MLDARERRAAIQQELLCAYGLPLVCLTMNIPGEIKRTPSVRLLFDEGVRRFTTVFESSVRRTVLLDETTGCEAFFAVDSPAERLKESVTAIEDSFPSARLFDFDVLPPSGEKLSRPVPRRCFICGGTAQDCARSRAHGLDALKAASKRLLDEFSADLFSNAAAEALIKEVHATPKPGLVDERNNGAHTDMNLALFEKSAEALRPYFRSSVLSGLSGTDMASLRREGLLAEQAMYSVTCGVNTHKGALFSMGLLLYGIGRALETGISPTEAAAAVLKSESRSAPSVPTHGEAAIQKYGCTGAYAEAENGFPHAVYASERLAAYRAENAPLPEAFALLDLIADVSDTNLYHRGGEEGYRYAVSLAKKAAALPYPERVRALFFMDDSFIEKKLSPGGSADLLALGLLLERWRQLSENLFPDWA